MDHELKDKILFSKHNLVTDGVFAEMHLIFCRNVLIYFNNSLQHKVAQLFHKSLIRNGFLFLGENEKVEQDKSEIFFELVSNTASLYKNMPAF
jgi:chemotaxis protein methyltransferase CheR